MQFAVTDQDARRLRFCLKDITCEEVQTRLWSELHVKFKTRMGISGRALNQIRTKEQFIKLIDNTQSSDEMSDELVNDSAYLLFEEWRNDGIPFHIMNPTQVCCKLPSLWYQYVCILILLVHR